MGKHLRHRIDEGVHVSNGNGHLRFDILVRDIFGEAYKRSALLEIRNQLSNRFIYLRHEEKQYILPDFFIEISDMKRNSGRRVYLHYSGGYNIERV